MKQKKCCSVRADKASLFMLAFDRTVSASGQVFLDKVLKSSEDLTAVYLCERVSECVCACYFGSRMCVRMMSFVHLSIHPSASAALILTDGWKYRNVTPPTGPPHAPRVCMCDCSRATPVLTRPSSRE